MEPPIGATTPAPIGETTTAFKAIHFFANGMISPDNFETVLDKKFAKGSHGSIRWACDLYASRIISVEELETFLARLGEVGPSAGNLLVEWADRR